MPGAAFEQAGTFYAIEQASSAEDACAQVAEYLMNSNVVCPPFLFAVPASAATAINLTPSIKASAAQVPTPTAPTVVVTLGTTSVSLVWNKVLSQGQVVYHILRSTTSGGPYTKLAQQFDTGYTDTNLSNGSYYYVVRATNPNGEATSAEVSAVITAA